jgi:hypothetical protein
MENEMGRACGTHGVMFKVLVGKSQGKRPLRNLGINRSTG